MREIIDRVATVVREEIGSDGTGHDWHHVDQVRKMALRIAQAEGGDVEIIELAALVHDIGDRKFHGSEESGDRKVRSLLRLCSVPECRIARVADIARRVSFKGAKVTDDMPTLEGKIVQDADCIFAIGAIGCARVFAYGGSRGRPLYDPTEEPVFADSADAYFESKRRSSLHHFPEKLFLLYDRLHTPTARAIAESRHQFLLRFYEQFLAEWEGRV